MLKKVFFCIKISAPCYSLRGDLLKRGSYVSYSLQIFAYIFINVDFEP